MRDGDGATTRNRVDWRAVACTAAALVGFAGNSLLTRAGIGSGAIDAASFTTVRLATGALTLWLLLQARSEGRSSLPTGWRPAAALASYMVAFSFAYVRVGASLGALLLFGSVQAFDENTGVGVVQLGYTSYGLFGNGSSATAAISRAVGDTDVDNLDALVQLDIPIAGNHALRSTARRFTAEESFPYFGGTSRQRLEQWRAEVEWIYDTTDDPLFATAGRRRRWWEAP